MKNLRPATIATLFGVRPALKRLLDDATYRKTFAAYTEHFREIDVRIEHEKGIMAFHRSFIIVGLALYKALDGEFEDRKELIGIIHEIMWNGPINKVIRLQAFFIRRSRDPFSSFLKNLGPRNEWFFPCPPWEKVEVDVENGVGWHQTKCPFVEFFKREGAVELTRAYCDMDIRMTELLPGHIELRRKEILSIGSDHCDFLYFRLPQLHT